MIYFPIQFAISFWRGVTRMTIDEFRDAPVLGQSHCLGSLTSPGKYLDY